MVLAGLHVTSRRPCWWSRTKAFLSSGNKLYFHVNSSRKTSIVLTPNMAALSRGCYFSSPVLTIAPSILRIFFFILLSILLCEWNSSLCSLLCTTCVTQSRRPSRGSLRSEVWMAKRTSGLEGKTTTLHVYHTFLTFLCRFCRTTTRVLFRIFGQVEASPPPPPPPKKMLSFPQKDIVIMTVNK